MVFNTLFIHIFGLVFLVMGLAILVFSVRADRDALGIFGSVVMVAFGIFCVTGTVTTEQHKLTGVVQYASNDGKQLVVNNITINCQGADCNSIENGDYVTLRCTVNQDADSLAAYVCTYLDREPSAFKPTK